MKSFKMALPKSLDGAVQSLGKDFQKHQIMAGGTDLLAGIKEHIQQPEVVVNLKSIPGLDQITVTDENIEIGALVKLVDLARSKDLGMFPSLAQSVAETATPQIRNVGTVGGNLCQRPRCWYFRDETYQCLRKGGKTCFAKDGENKYHAIFENKVSRIVHPSNLAGPLISYGARVEIQGAQGKREVLLEKFFVTAETDVTRENILKPDEVLTKVIVPKANGNKNSAYYETREKQSFDWALCGASFNLMMDGKTIKDARVVLNAVAPRPIRRSDLEEMLKGQKASSALFKKVAEAATKGATPLAQNAYKVDLLKVVVERGLNSAAEA